MIKIISLLRRREGMTHEEFIRHWEEIHAPLIMRIPEVRRYVQSHVVAERDTPVAAIDGDIDGIVELWYDDMEACERVWKSPAIQPVIEDSKKFIGASKSFYIEEKIIISGR